MFIKPPETVSTIPTNNISVSHITTVKRSPLSYAKAAVFCIVIAKQIIDKCKKYDCLDQFVIHYKPTSVLLTSTLTSLVLEDYDKGSMQV